MELTVVGSGTVVPDPERVCSGYFVESGDARLLMDCGPGVTHHLARFRLPWDRLTHLAISHFHADHVGDVPGLLFSLKYGRAAPRHEPLTVLGPTGTAAFFRHLQSAFGDYVLDPGFPITVRELGTGDTADLAPGVRLTAHATPHTGESLCYRVDGPGAAVAYTGDTGFDDGVARFLHGAGILISECSLPDDMAMDSHLTPDRAAAMAVIAEPGQLLLTHVYPPLRQEDLPGLIRAGGWDGPIRVAHDGLRLPL